MILARPAAIVFDFDLTLVDSSQGFVVCHTYAALRHGLTPPTLPAILRTIGTPLPVVFRRLYGDDHASLSEAYLKDYQAKADDVMSDLTVYIDGAKDALTKLAAAGVPLGIVSQKLRYRVDDVLRRGGVIDKFAVVLGGDDVAALKPDPAGLLAAVDKLGVHPGDAIYVGDTTIDAETAERAGTAFVGVLTGVTSADDFAPYEPAACLESVKLLPGLLGIA